MVRTYFNKLYERVIAIYPNLEMKDWFYITLQNDSNGLGDYIAKWDHPDYLRPTDEQLEAIPV